MTEFDFQTDDEGREFCELIIQEMISRFNISKEEAVGRLNDTWKGLTIGKDDIVFHEDEEFWANSIYYGKDSQWWLNPPILKPLPHKGK
jgi:hypothetical protein